eukprot:7830038-Prorocentrum_lima.AAC.1
MMLSMTNGRNKTLTTTDIANALLNAPINKDAAMLVSAPNMLARLGIVETGTVWKIRRAAYGLRESQALAGGERQGPFQAHL